MAIALPRLRRIGLEVPQLVKRVIDGVPEPHEHRLCDLLSDEDRARAQPLQHAAATNGQLRARRGPCDGPLTSSGCAARRANSRRQRRRRRTFISRAERRGRGRGETTANVDLRIEPERHSVLRALPALKTASVRGPVQAPPAGSRTRLHLDGPRALSHLRAPQRRRSSPAGPPPAVTGLSTAG